RRPGHVRADANDSTVGLQRAQAFRRAAGGRGCCLESGWRRNPERDLEAVHCLEQGRRQVVAARWVAQRLAAARETASLDEAVEQSRDRRGRRWRVAT